MSADHCRDGATDHLLEAVQAAEDERDAAGQRRRRIDGRRQREDGHRCTTRAGRHAVGMASECELFNRRAFLACVSPRLSQTATAMDDSEVLDWGHEDELAVAVRGSDQRTFDLDDAEDAVSLGGDEEDEFLTYQSRAPQHAQKSARHQRQDPPDARSDSQPQEQPAERTPDPSSLPAPSHSFGTLVHALPPKPVLSSVPFVHPSHPSIIEATAMASRADRDKRNGAGSKPEYNDPLPPGWEIKYPRNGRGLYYYNIHTQESTWSRPTAPSTREKRPERSDPRDDPLDKPLSTRNGDALIPRVGRPETGDMSYEDRHYRPGESARREERPLRSTQRTHSYKPDSYSPSHSNSRPLSPSPRARDRESTPPPGRLPSPSGSYGDRDGLQSSYREAPSVAPPSCQDRLRVPHERPRERTQRDDPTPSDTERRNPPRDTERSSTTSTLSASSPPPTSRTRRVCSSRGGGQSISQTSREALGVELRHTISCSFLYDFLAWTHGRSSWIPVFPFLLFVPPFPPIFFFRAKITRLLYSWLSGICDYPTLLDQAYSAGFGSAPRWEKEPFLPR